MTSVSQVHEVIVRIRKGLDFLSKTRWKFVDIQKIRFFGGDFWSDFWGDSNVEYTKSFGLKYGWR
jgi:hypothetical protein